MRELIVRIDGSTLLSMHRAKRLCMEEPLKDLRTALTQWIVQALLRACAESVQGKTKTRYSNLRHM